MPTVILDRIPLPNLKLYSTVSVLLLSCCLYYAVVTTSDPDWRAQLSAAATTPPPVDDSTAATAATGDVVGDLTAQSPAGAAEALSNASGLLDQLQQCNDDAAALKPTSVELLPAADGPAETTLPLPELEPESETLEPVNTEPRSFTGHMRDVVSFMCQEAVCIWTLINMAYCCLILLGKSIQKVVFGELRISEQQHLKDKFWNFVFYKFIFVFGVVNVQFMHEVVLWVAWFSILGFLHLLSQLCKDRFEYLSFSPTTPGWSHIRLVTLLSSILTLSGLMFIICIYVGFFGGMNTFAFMAAECVLLMLRTLHVLIRYVMFLYDMRQGGGLAEEIVSWEKRGPFAYYVELAFDVASLTIDLAHHMHMLVWANIFLSMASLVIVMHLRFLTNEIQRKFKKHRNYLWVLNHMEKSYPLATAADLSLNADNCAICWERMDTARKLPCAHLFHNTCLQSWLEQDPSCPTCRLALSVQQSVSPHPTIDRIEEPENPRRANNHFFQFNGSRYVSWLPTFSVEVTHINSVFRVGDILPTATHTSQVRNMAHQVQQMFPTYPISVIIADLQVSRSMEVTIDNILEGRLPVPAVFQFDDDAEFGEAGGSATRATALAAATVTIDNFLEGRLPVPAVFQFRVPASTARSASSASAAVAADDRFAASPSASSSSLDQFDDDAEFGEAGGSATTATAVAAAAVTFDNFLEDRLPVPAVFQFRVPASTARSASSASAAVAANDRFAASPSASSSSLDSGYEIERNSNIFGNQNELLRDESLEDIPLGDRFSKSANEREKILQRRKEMLMAIARKRYMEKSKSELNVPASEVVRHRNKTSIEADADVDI